MPCRASWSGSAASTRRYRASVIERFGEDVFLRGISAVYEEVLQKKNRGPGAVQAGG